MSSGLTRNIPTPSGILQEVISDYFKDKIKAGAYEPSSSSYRSRWFCVLKKDGKSLRTVHDLQPLNGVIIKDAGLPPIVDHFIEGFAGRACYSLFDLFVGYDHRDLNESSFPRPYYLSNSSRSPPSHQTPNGLDEFRSHFSWRHRVDFTR
jgi:hypothetical protein